MSIFRRILVLLLLVGGFWYFYGDDMKQSGMKGTSEAIQEDINNIKNNSHIENVVDRVEREFRLVIGQLQNTLENTKQDEPVQPAPDKPELATPNQQSFSVHNVEIGATRTKVEQKIGAPKRKTLNEYGVEWEAYHEDYHNFFMAAYNDQSKVVGLYTNQDLLSSKSGISFASTRASVLKTLGEPLETIQKGMTRYQIKGNGEYDTFLVDQNYVTIFYDKHEQNHVTAIQIISRNLEQDKQGFYAEPSKPLKVGFEYQLFDLTNAARVKHQLPTLTWDERARKTARDHSVDMAKNGYFSHKNLDGQSPFDRMREDDISFITAGENILNQRFERLTVGVAFDDESRPFYTENFLTR
ncbi:serine protease [Pontibacillus yanchengensis Y32]|uniref:Serine protease n=1 Tax=Pontibacillus yanchengensis Y32 TaxID=1385514 RepID=A0A0A2T5Y4_9BACI|nr:serine protease [Pontibacillus yanchengensis Y32]